MATNNVSCRNVIPKYSSIAHSPTPNPVGWTWYPARLMDYAKSAPGIRAFARKRKIRAEHKTLGTADPLKRGNAAGLSLRDGGRRREL